MAFTPLNRNQLGFVAEEWWPGGGEYGDGRDMTGAAEYCAPYREEWHPLDELEAGSALANADEEDAEEYGGVIVSDAPLAKTLEVDPRIDGDSDLTEDEDTELLDVGDVEQRVVAANTAAQLARFERDGIRRIGSRLAACLEHGWAAFECRDKRRRMRSIVHDGRTRGDSWKRHRVAQHRRVPVIARDGRIVRVDVE